MARKSPEEVAGMLVFLEYEEPQIRRTLIEECGMDPAGAKALYDKTKAAYDEEEAEEDRRAFQRETMRPLAEQAVEEAVIAVPTTTEGLA